jgi:hypothetical protein
MQLKKEDFPPKFRWTHILPGITIVLLVLIWLIPPARALILSVLAMVFLIGGSILALKRLVEHKIDHYDEDK